MPHENFLILVESVNVIELNNKNRNACKITVGFGVGKTEVQNILKRKSQVLDVYENNTSGARKLLCRNSQNYQMNGQCLKKFQYATKRCVPVSGP